MIAHALCSPAILQQVRYRSVEGQQLEVGCDVNDTIHVNGVHVSETDVVTENGIVHVIDELLLPDSVTTVAKQLVEMDLGQFQEYAQQAGLSGILRGDYGGNYTFFVPNAEAFSS